MAVDATRGLLIRRRVLRGAASNTVGQVVSLAVSFLLTPFILGRVGALGYGLWVLVSSVVAYAALLDLGIGSAVVKYVAEFRARRDTETSRALLATSLRLYLGLGILAFGLSLLLVPIFPLVFKVNPGDERTAQVLVALTGLNLGLSLASAPTTSVLAGLQRFDLYNVVSVGGTLIGAVATIAVLLAGGGVVGMVAVNIPVTLLMRAASLVLIRRVAPELPFGYAGASRAITRRVFGYSWSVLAAQLSGQLQKKSDEIVIGAFLAVSAITPYSLGRRLSEVTFLLTNQFIRVLLPVASELHATEERERLVTLYLVSTRLTTAIFLAIGLPIVLLPSQILGVWVGSGYPDAVPVIVILSCASFVLTTSWPAGSILQGMARFGPVAFSSVASGVANLVLSIYLVQRVGIVGVAIGTLIPTAIEVLGFVIPYTMWVLGIQPGRAVREAWMPALLPGIPAAVALYALRELVGPTSLVAVTAVATCGALVYGIGYLSLRATSMERQTLSETAGRVVEAALRLRARTVASK